MLDASCGRVVKGVIRCGALEGRVYGGEESQRGVKSMSGTEL